MTHSTQHMNKRKFDDIAILTQTLKGTFEEILDIKKKGKKELFPSLLNSGTNSLLELKRLADFTREEEEEATQLTACRSKLDTLDSQLHVLQYEKDCYLAEIEECRQYGSDDISRLLSTESGNEADEMQLERKRHTSSSINGDSHHQMMTNLNSKLLEKQRLTKVVEGLHEQKRQLKESVAADTKRLSALDAKLKTVAKNSSLFQQHIQIVPLKQTKQLSNLSHLPAPLFLIYRQAQSYSEFFDNDVEVLLHGDISDASSQKTPTTPHPLSVTIRFPAKLYFSVKYYPNLKVVTASTDKVGILNNLFPNDNGRTFPSVSCDYLASEPGRNVTVEQLEGLPYKWTQAICHLEYLSTSLLSTSSMSDSSSEDDAATYTFHNVIKRLKSSLVS